MKCSTLLTLLVYLVVAQCLINDKKHVPDGTVSFEGSEHRTAANAGYIKVLELSDTSPPTLSTITVSVPSYNFSNANGVLLYSYGDIVAFGGDFFGPENELSIVCTGNTKQVARALFLAAFQQLWSSQDYEYIAKIRSEMQRELDQIKANPGAPPYSVFEELPESRWTNVYKSLLEASLLLTNNLDHFSSCAEFTYTIGHQLALDTAEQAGSLLQSCNNNTSLFCLNSVIQLLNKAYVVNAFSDHFLTDLFASGHIRTPRRTLTTTCLSPRAFISTFLATNAPGGLASQWMHDEDNRNGIVVTNARGDIWTAYGDDNYFDGRNALNRRIVEEATQISRDEVFQAFQGTLSNVSFRALYLIPDASKLDQYNINNTCPLFKADADGLLYVRADGQIRPGAWHVLQGRPGSPNQYCDYSSFTFESCPSAIFSKIEGYVEYFGFGHSSSLDYDKNDIAWITSRPQPIVTTITVYWALVGLITASILVVSSFAVIGFDTIPYFKQRRDNWVPWVLKYVGLCSLALFLLPLVLVAGLHYISPEQAKGTSAIQYFAFTFAGIALVVGVILIGLNVWGISLLVTYLINRKHQAELGEGVQLYSSIA